MKLLFSTYSCFPCKTSEPGNAWRAFYEALRNQHEVEVIDGLNDGDVVLVDGQYALPDDTAIRVEPVTE